MPTGEWARNGAALRLSARNTADATKEPFGCCGSEISRAGERERCRVSGPNGQLVWELCCFSSFSRALASRALSNLMIW